VPDHGIVGTLLCSRKNMHPYPAVATCILIKQFINGIFISLVPYFVKPAM